MNEPSGNQDFNVEGGQQGESSIARLKRQKREAVEYANQMGAQVRELRDEISSLKDAIKPMTQQAGANQDQSLESLASIVTSQDGSVDPDLAARALVQLVREAQEKSLEKVRGEVGQTVTQRFQDQNALLQTEREIVNIHGQQALNQDSPIFQMADRILASSGNQNPTPADYKLAFYEASHRLGQQPVEPTQDTPPPEGVSSTAASTSTADYKAQRDVAMEKGDTRGALKAVIGNLGITE